MKRIVPEKSLACVLAFVLSVTAESTKTVAQEHYDSASELVVAVTEPVLSLETPEKRELSTTQVMHHLYESLVQFDSDFQIRPLLARRFEVRDDGRKYVFWLRDDVTFHNGEELTADDVVWVWNRHLDPSRNWGYHCREIFDGSAEMFHLPSEIVEVSAIDALTVEFRLKSPNALFLHQVAHPYCQVGIYHRDSVAEDGSWRTPIGTGPYRFEAWDNNGDLLLRRNANYRTIEGARSGLVGPRVANFEFLRFRHFETEGEALQAIVDGTAEIWPGAPDSVAEDAQGIAGIKAEIAMNNHTAVLLLQTRYSPVLKDVRLRRAISLAIDRDDVAGNAVAEGWPGNPSMVPFSLAQHTPEHEIGGGGVNLQRVRELQRASGYDGQPIRLSYATDRYPVLAKAAIAVMRQLRDADFNVVAAPMTWDALLAEAGAQKNDMSAFGYSPRTDPAAIYSTFIDQKVEQNWAIWEDTEAAMWVMNAMHEVDGAKRQRLFDKLHTKMLEQVPLIALFNEADVTVMRDDVAGFEPWAGTIPRYWGVYRVRQGAGGND